MFLIKKKLKKKISRYLLYMYTLTSSSNQGQRYNQSINFNSYFVYFQKISSRADNNNGEELKNETLVSQIFFRQTAKQYRSKNSFHNSS